MSEGRISTDSDKRKEIPVASGCLDYFPDALAAVAELSFEGNKKHNPGQPLHWARGKSTDEADALIRHFLERGTHDTDGVRHSVKVAWRALALLQKELELAYSLPVSRGSRDVEKVRDQMDPVPFNGKIVWDGPLVGITQNTGEANEVQNKAG